MLARPSEFLAAAAVVWSIAAGVWIWFTPIGHSGVSTQTWSSSTSQGQPSTIVQSVPVNETRRFADVSLLGPIPLVIPVVLAGLGALAIWRRKGLLLMLSPTAALLLFCFIAGFSIGPAYIPAGAAMLFAVVPSLFGRKSP